MHTASGSMHPGSVPMHSTVSTGYLPPPQLQQLPQLASDFEQMLNRAHEVYRAGDFQRALQLCHAARLYTPPLLPPLLFFAGKTHVNCLTQYVHSYLFLHMAGDPEMEGGGLCQWRGY